jgi:surface protein
MSNDYFLHRVIGRGEVVPGPAEPPIEPPERDDWETPSEWPDIVSEVGPTDDKFIGLVAIEDGKPDNGDGRPVFFRIDVASSGTYTVDWGDGSTPDVYNGGDIAEHMYDQDNTELIDTSYGYKIAKIVVTASDDITNILFNVIAPNLPGHYNANSFRSINWLHQCWRFPGFTANLTTKFLNMNIMVIDIKDGTSLSGSAASAFTGCRFLRRATFPSDYNPTATNSMFANCSALVKGPALLTSNSTNCSVMFSGCSSLVEVPNYNFSNSTVSNSTFANCSSLTSVDVTLGGSVGSAFTACNSLIKARVLGTFTDCINMFFQCSLLDRVEIGDTSSVTTMNGMFNGCERLRELPSNLDTSSCSNFFNFLNNCRSIKEVLGLDFSSGTNFQNCFSGCSSLQEVDPFDCFSGLNMQSTFSACFSLREIPNSDYSNATDTSSMFQSCRSLREIGDLDISSSTSTGQMFAAALSLKKIGNIDMSASTVATNMFNGCTDLEFIESITSSSSLTTVLNMFGGCSSLRAVPLFDTSSVTTFGTGATNGMFYQCYSLKSVPPFNMSGVATLNNIQGMFRDCIALKFIPAFPGLTATGTAYNSNFLNCHSLTRLGIQRWPDVTTIALNASYNLGEEALEEIFTNLPTVTGSKTINVNACRGKDLADVTIATAKGWTVVT